MKDRFNLSLLLVFALSMPMCVWAWFFDITLLLYLPALPFFCAQLWLCRVTKRVWLRLLPLLPIVLLLGLALSYYLWGSGWDMLGALIFSLMAISPAAGVLLAWGSFLLRERCRGGELKLSRGVVVMLLVVLGCGIMAFVERGWGPSYLIKSGMKVLVFLGFIILYAVAFRDGCVGGWFQKPDRASLKRSLLLAAAVFFGLLAGYVLLLPWLDLSAIPEQLAQGMGVTAENFPLVAAYIILCNSLLEELFFRGFAFLTLRRYCTPALAWGFSAVSFALYHVSIMDGWFHPVLLALMILGLGAAGVFFGLLDRKGSVWNSWLIHMAANLAINIIGFRLFGIL